MTTPRLPVSLCIHCSSPRIERQVNAPLQWRCLACYQEFEQPRVEMRPVPDAIEIGGQRSPGPFNNYQEFCEYAMLHGIAAARQQLTPPPRPYDPTSLEVMSQIQGFSDRLDWLIDGLVRGDTAGAARLEQLSFQVVPEVFGDSAVTFHVVIGGREFDLSLPLEDIRQAVIAGAERCDELTRDIAYQFVQRFRNRLGRSQPTPPPPGFTLDDVSQALNHGSRVTLTLGEISQVISNLSSLPWQKEPPKKRMDPSCSNCAYLMRGQKLGEPHICNAFHAIADLHSPTECSDYERK